MGSNLALYVAMVQPFWFAGGSEAEFCRAIASEFRVPVSVMATDERVKAFEIESKDLDTVRKVAATKSGRRRPKSGWGYAGQAFPEWLYFLRSRSPNEERLALAAGNIEFERTDSRVELKTVGGPVQAKSLVPKDWSKKLAVHWFYEDAFIHIYAVRANERDVALSIAESLGAELVETETAYRIEFAPSNFRAMARNTLWNASQGLFRKGPLEYHCLVTREALVGVSDKALKSLYEADGRRATETISERWPLPFRSRANALAVISFDGEYRFTREEVMAWRSPNSAVDLATVQLIPSSMGLFSIAAKGRRANGNSVAYVF